MIFPPNRPLPLNGSNCLNSHPGRARSRFKRPATTGWLLLTAFFLLTTSCGLLKKVPDEEPLEKETGLDPIEGQVEENREKEEWIFEPEDTTQIGVAPNREQPPAEDPTRSLDTLVSDQSSLYRISVALPFLTQMRDTLGRANEKAYPSLHFLQGLRLALDSMTTPRKTIQWRIFDTEASRGRMYQLLSEDTSFIQSDIIIGPWRSSNLQMMAKVGKSREQIVFSPFYPNAPFEGDYQQFVQVNPSLKAHCEALTFFLRNRFQPEEVLLVCREKQAEVERLALFQEANALYARDTAVAKFPEYLIPDETDAFQEMDFRPYLDEGIKAVVVPSWSNEAFVYSLMRLLSTQKEEEEEVMVLGMPQWMEFNISSFNYYEDLQLHIPIPVFADPQLPEAKQFRKHYLEKYGTLPTTESYLGYDLATYLTDLLNREGLGFIRTLDVFAHEGLGTSFHFEPVAGDPRPDMEIPPFRYYENTHVKIIRFKDFFFQSASTEE